MVDTALLHYQLPHSDYDALFKRINSLSRENKVNLYPVKNITNPTCYKTTFLHNKGIPEFVFCKFRSKTNFILYYIELKVHMKLLIESNVLDLTKAIDMPLIQKKFNALMNELSPTLPDFNKWSYSRIDYAVTIKTSHVNVYIELFKRGNIQKPFSKNIPEMLARKGSFYLPSNKGVLTLNFYDKHDQLTKKQQESGFQIDESILMKAENTLRLEVQCRRAKLENIKECKYFKDVSEKIKNFYFTPRVSYYVVLFKYLMLTNKSTAPFVSLEKAKEILKASSLSRTKVTHAYILLHQIAQSQGLWDFRKTFDSDNDFNNAMTLIKKAGINPLLIPAHYGIDELPSLVPDITSFLYGKASNY